MKIIITLAPSLGYTQSQIFNLTANFGTVTPDTATYAQLLAGYEVEVDELCYSVTITPTNSCTNYEIIVIQDVVLYPVSGVYACDFTFSGNPLCRSEGVLITDLYSMILDDTLNETSPYFFSNGDIYKSSKFFASPQGYNQPSGLITDGYYIEYFVCPDPPTPPVPGSTVEINPCTAVEVTFLSDQPYNVNRYKVYITLPEPSTSDRMFDVRFDSYSSNGYTIYGIVVTVPIYEGQTFGQEYSYMGVHQTVDEQWSPMNATIYYFTPSGQYILGTC